MLVADWCLIWLVCVVCCVLLSVVVCFYARSLVFFCRCWRGSLFDSCCAVYVMCAVCRGLCVVCDAWCLALVGLCGAFVVWWRLVGACCVGALCLSGGVDWLCGLCVLYAICWWGMLCGDSYLMFVVCCVLCESFVVCCVLCGSFAVCCLFVAVRWLVLVGNCLCVRWCCRVLACVVRCLVCGVCCRLVVDACLLVAVVALVAVYWC